jgi:hypothetical protein
MHPLLVTADIAIHAVFNQLHLHFLAASANEFELVLPSIIDSTVELMFRIIMATTIIHMVEMMMMMMIKMIKMMIAIAVEAKGSKCGNRHVSSRLVINMKHFNSGNVANVMNSTYAQLK